jgi:hypothetical protein
LCDIIEFGFVFNISLNILKNDSGSKIKFFAARSYLIKLYESLTGLVELTINDLKPDAFSASIKGVTNLVAKVPLG